MALPRRELEIPEGNGGHRLGKFHKGREFDGCSSLQMLFDLIQIHAVAYNCHIKLKLLTSNENYPHQMKTKKKLLTLNETCSHQMKFVDGPTRN